MIPKTMKAVVLNNVTKASDITLTDFPVPKIKPGWVLVKIKAFGLNHSEQILRLSEIQGGIVCSTGILGGVYVLNNFDPIKFIPNGVYLSSFFSNYPTQETINYIYSFLAEHKLIPYVGKVFPFSEIAKACIAMDSGTVNGKIVVTPHTQSRTARMLWGTTRAQINSLVKGVSVGYSKSIELNGVGYKARMDGKNLVLTLGFSHDVPFETPKGITIVCETQTTLKVSGVDKQLVGQVAAEIRKYRKPEPYKGKGIRVDGEYVRRKEGKKK